MIQPISNSVNFGAINIGGMSYSATKAISYDIRKIQNPKTQALVKENLAGLQEHASVILPKDKQFGLFFNQRGLAVNGNGKVKIAIREVTSQNEAPIFTISKRIKGKNSKEGRIQEVINDVFAKAAEKMDSMFVNNETSKVAQGIDISV